MWWASEGVYLSQSSLCFLVCSDVSFPIRPELPLLAPTDWDDSQSGSELEGLDVYVTGNDTQSDSGTEDCHVGRLNDIDVGEFLFDESTFPSTLLVLLHFMRPCFHDTCFLFMLWTCCTVYINVYNCTA